MLSCEPGPESPKGIRRPKVRSSTFSENLCSRTASDTKIYMAKGNFQGNYQKNFTSIEVVKVEEKYQKKCQFEVNSLVFWSFSITVRALLET